MVTPNPSPVRVRQHDEPAPPTTSAARNGTVSLVLCVAACVSAPMLLLVPLLGFLPATVAGAGIVVAWAGLRGETRGTGLAITALITSVVLFALLTSLATFWNFVVAIPAVSHDDGLLRALGEAWRRLFGF